MTTQLPGMIDPNTTDGGNPTAMADEIDCDNDECMRLRTDDFFIHPLPYPIERWRNYRILQV